MATSSEGARGRARAAAAAGAVGILLNVAAVVLLQGQPHCFQPGDLTAWAPAVAVRFLAAPGAEAAFRALLGLSLAVDAVFNVMLGLALLLFAAGLGAAWPRWLRGLGAVAGLSSLPLAGQLTSDAAARLLRVSGPLWLAFFAVVSVKLWRRAPA